MLHYYALKGYNCDSVKWLEGSLNRKIDSTTWWSKYYNQWVGQNVKKYYSQSPKLLSLCSIIFEYLQKLPNECKL